MELHPTSTGADYVKIHDSDVGDDLTVISSFSPTASTRVYIEDTDVVDRLSVDLGNGNDTVNIINSDAKVLDVDLYGANNNH